jgi:hypothetical protein
MNSKRLIIAFFAVSLAALCASCAAVISVARTYNSLLFRAEITEAVEYPHETRVVPETTDFTDIPEITFSEEDITVSLTEEVTDEAAVTEEITTEESTIPAFFTLIIDNDKLVIISPEGERIYERITAADRLHPKDLEVLITGISFDTREDAMSAVYDIIS